MINVETGEIKLDDYGVIFHANLTLEQFRNSHTPPLEVLGGKEHKYSDTYLFNAQIDGLNAEFEISFGYTKLVRLQFIEKIILSDEKELNRKLVAAAQVSHEHYVTVLNEVTDIVQKIDTKQKEKLDAWLIQTTKAVPPYEYKWGEIVSVIDPKSPRGPEIKIWFGKEFPEGMDYKAFYKDRRERWDKESAKLRTLAPGEMPPGFSRKTR